MNEEYLLGAYNSFGGQEKLKVDFNTWVSKIKENDNYKQGMFNSFGGQEKLGASYDDWNSKVFGLNKEDETTIKEDEGVISGEELLEDSNKNKSTQKKEYYPTREIIESEKEKDNLFYEKEVKVPTNLEDVNKNIKQTEKLISTYEDSPLFNDFIQKTKLTEEDDASIDEDINNTIQNKGVWNTIKQGAKNLWNIANISNPLNQVSTDPLVDSKKIAVKEFREKKIDFTQEQLENRAIEIEKDKRKKSLIESKEREYLKNLPELDKSRLTADRLFKEELLTEREKDYELAFEFRKRNLTQQANLIKAKAKRVEEIKNIADKWLEDKTITTPKEQELLVAEYNKLSSEILSMQELGKKEIEANLEQYDRYLEGKEELKDTQTKLDLFKRDYGFLINIAGNIASAEGSLLSGGFDLLPYLVNVKSKYAPLTVTPIDTYLSKKSSEIADVIKEDTEKIQGGIMKPMSVDDINTSGDFGSWFWNTAIAQQIPILTMVSTGAGGVGALTASSVGTKYGEMVDEIKEGANYSSSKQLFAPLISGTAEGVGFAVDALITRGALKTVSNLARAERELFTKSLIGKSKDLIGGVSKEMFKGAYKEVPEEILVEFTNNVIDKFMLGKDVNLGDNLKDAAAGSLVFTLMPGGAKILQSVMKPFTNENKIGKLVSEISALESQLVTGENKISDDVKKTLIDKLYSKRKALQGLAMQVSQDIRGMSNADYKKILELENKAKEIREDAISVNEDKGIDKKTKELILSDFKEDLNKIDEEQKNIIEKIEPKKETTEEVKESTVTELTKDFTDALGESEDISDVANGVSKVIVDGAEVLIKSDGDKIVLDKIRVDEEDRGNKVAEKALNKIVALADEKGLDITLNVLPEDNTVDKQRLISLYEKAGFKLLDGDKMERKAKVKETVEEANKDFDLGVIKDVVNKESNLDESKETTQKETKQKVDATTPKTEVESKKINLELKKIKPSNPQEGYNYFDIKVSDNKGNEIPFNNFRIELSEGSKTARITDINKTFGKDDKNKGAGKLAYIELGKILGKKGYQFVNRGSLTEGSRKVWESLVKDGLAKKNATGYIMYNEAFKTREQLRLDKLKKEEEFKKEEERLIKKQNNKKTIKKDSDKVLKASFEKGKYNADENLNDGIYVINKDGFLKVNKNASNSAINRALNSTSIYFDTGTWDYENNPNNNHKGFEVVKPAKLKLVKNTDGTSDYVVTEKGIIRFTDTKPSNKETQPQQEDSDDKANISESESNKNEKKTQGDTSTDKNIQSTTIKDDSKKESKGVQPTTKPKTNTKSVKIKTNKNQYTVSLVDGKLDIKPRVGKVVSDGERRKVTKLYAESIDYGSGRVANFQGMDNATPNQKTERVIEDSENPQEIVSEIRTLRARTDNKGKAVEVSKEDAIYQVLSNNALNDDAKRQVTDLGSYYTNVGFRENKNKIGIDSAREMAESISGQDISMDEMLSFLESYQNLRDYKESLQTQSKEQELDLKERFKQVTGVELTESLMDEIIPETEINTDEDLDINFESDPDLDVPFQTQSNIAKRLAGIAMTNLVDQLNLTGLAKAVYVWSNNEINSFLEKLGINSVQKQGLDYQENLDKWVGDREIVESGNIQDLRTGEPVVVKVYHGTTNEFYEFDADVKGNIEGHLGRVNYFTSDEYDANQNYQSDGPDLTGRIEREVEILEQQFEDKPSELYQKPSDFLKYFNVNVTQKEIDDSYGDERAVAELIASKKLKGNTDKVLEVYVRMDNPVVLGNRNWVEAIPKELYEDSIEDATQEIADENGITIEEAQEDYQWDIEQRAMENEGVENPLIEALQKALNDNGYQDSNASEILDDIGYGTEIDLDALENKVRKGELYDNLDGELASSQVISDMFQNLGYDGIVLTDVSNRFKNMGLSSNTSHVHVFNDNANNIKLADGTNTTFNENTKDIRFQQGTVEIERIVEEAKGNNTYMKAPNGNDSNLTESQWVMVRTNNFKNWFGDWQNNPEDASKVLDENGEPLVVYHGSDSIFNEFNTYSIFFAKDIEVANDYYSNEGKIYATFLNLRKPLKEYGGHNNWNDIRPEIESLKRYRLVNSDGDVVQEGIEYEADAENNALDLAYEEASLDNENIDIDDVTPYVVESYYDNENISTDELFSIAIEQNHDGVIIERVVDAAGEDGSFATDIFIASKPNQIKSATENDGSFSKYNNDIRFQKELSEVGAHSMKRPTWISTAKQGLEKINQKNATPEQWVKMISDKGGKGTTQELEWIGLEDYLNEYKSENNVKSIPKQVVEDYVNDNQIEIVEVSKQAESFNENILKQELSKKISEKESIVKKAEKLNIEFEFDMGGEHYAVINGELLESEDYDNLDSKTKKIIDDFYQVEEEIEVIETKISDGLNVGNTKYSGYTLEGGENYREVLLTLPNKNFLHKVVELENGEFIAVNKETGNRNLLIPKSKDRLLVERAIKSSEKELNQIDDKTYKSSHWDESNILAHLRINERTLPNGERVMFIEEVQSDWAQDGKKKGFKGNYREKSLSEPKFDGKYWYLYEKSTGEQVSNQSFNTENDAWKMIEQNMRLLDDGVPNMPYKKTDQWVGMAFRRVMQMATQEGFDRIAWVTGEQSADRYDLSKTVSKVRLINMKGKYPNASDGKPYAIIAYDKEGYNVIDERIDKDEAERYVGKEVAQKLNEDSSKVDEFENLIEGEDLKVGGEGMKTFYNSILPKVAKKEARRFDKKANIDVVDFGNEGVWVEVKDFTENPKYPSFDWVDSKGTKFGNSFATREEALKNKPKDEDVINPEKKVGKQLSIKITDKSRSNLSKAIPLFQQDNGTQNNAENIYGFVYNDEVYINRDKARLDTPIHEFGHLWINHIKSKHKDVYDRGLALIKGTEYHTAVKNNPSYKGLGKKAQLEEALAQAIGEKGVKILEQTKLKQFQVWFRNVFRKIAQGFGLTNMSPEQIANITLDKFTTYASAELLSGNKIVDRKQKKSNRKDKDVTNIDVVMESEKARIKALGDLKKKIEEKRGVEEDVKKEVQDYVLQSIENSALIGFIKKNELSKILTLVRKGKTFKNLEKAIESIDELMPKLEERLKDYKDNIQKNKEDLKQKAEAQKTLTEDLRKEVIKFINAQIDGRNINDIKKREINSLMTIVKNTKSITSFTNALYKVDEIFVKVENKVLFKNINKILGRKLSKKVYGRIKANLVSEDAETILNEVKNLFKKIKKTRRENYIVLNSYLTRQESILSKELDPKQEVTEQEYLELEGIDASIKILNAVLSESHETANVLLNEVLTQITDIYDNGRSELKALREAQKEYLDKKIKEYREDAGHGKSKNSLKTTQDLDKEAKRTINKLQRGIFDFTSGWVSGSLDSLMTIISKSKQRDRDSSPLVDLVNRMKRKERFKKSRINNFSDFLISKQKELFGSQRKAEIAFKKRRKVTVRRRPDNSDSNTPLLEIEVTHTDAELLNLWMNYKNQDLRPALELNGYDEQFFEELELSREMKRYGMFLYDFYETMHKESDEIYKKMYFHSMGKVNYYAGKVSRRGDASPQADLSPDGNNFSVHTTGFGSQKERTSNAPIVAMDANKLAFRAIAETSHFIAYAEIHKEYAKLLGDEAFNKAVKFNNPKYGDKIVKALNFYKTNDLEKGGVQKGYMLLDFLGRNIIRSTLAGKIKVGVTQTISFFNGASDLPPKLEKNFFEYYNPKSISKGFKELSEVSQFLKNRYDKGGLENAVSGLTDIANDGVFPDFADIEANRKAMARFMDKTLQKLMFNVKVGDKIGVAGAVPVYLAWKDVYRKQGLTESEAKVKALLKFESSADRSQQTNSTFGKSEFQKHPILRYFAMYATSPIQNMQNANYHWRELFRNLSKEKNGKSSNMRNIVGILNYQFAQPMAYVYLSQLFAGSILSVLGFGDEEPDDADKTLANSFILSNYGSIPMLGGIITGIVDYASGKEFSYGGLVSSALLKGITDLESDFKTLERTNDPDTATKYKKRIGKKLGGMLLSVPDIFMSGALDFEEIYWNDDIDVMVKTWKALGYSNYAIEQSIKRRMTRKEAEQKRLQEEMDYKKKQNKPKKKKVNELFLKGGNQR